MLTMLAPALLLAAALADTSPAPPPPVLLTVSEAHQSFVGQWQGKLDYRDYRADKWFD